MQTYTNEDLDKMVLYFLSRHVGENNKIERWALVERVFGSPVPLAMRTNDNKQDRDIRESVRRLRNQGHLICDMGDGDGRWIAQTARAMKRAAAQKFPNLLQPSLFGAPVQEMPDFEDVLEDALEGAA